MIYDMICDVYFLVLNALNIYKKKRKMNQNFGNEWKTSNKKALFWACSNEHETIVNCLVEYGAKIQGNEDALIGACRNGVINIVKYFSRIWSKG